ncbi:serpin family protein [Sorangium sp. So ce1128]
MLVSILVGCGSNQTDGKSRELLAGDVSPDTQLVLVNAISFDAAWRKPFKEAATKPGPFRRGDNTSATAEMMQSARHPSRRVAARIT